MNDNAHSLERFVYVQLDNYEKALKEIKSGKKRSHWIWFIFPQLKGLGRSIYSKYFGIDGIDEARCYLEHDILGDRLREITQELLNLNENDPVKIMGYIDSMKLQSCMTLFAQVSENDSVFHKALDKFFNGIQDEKTIQLLKG